MERLQSYANISTFHDNPQEIMMGAQKQTFLVSKLLLKSLVTPSHSSAVISHRAVYFKDRIYSRRRLPHVFSSETNLSSSKNCIRENAVEIYAIL
jgi:hypothetical protein